MSELPPTVPQPPGPGYVPSTYDQDQDHLRLLSIFWYILAGLQAFGACIALLYVAGGLIIAVTGMGTASHSDDAAAAGTIGGIFACFGIFLLLLIGTIAFLSFKTGQSLRRRKNLTLIYIMAALSCLSVPIGTILGIFTFVVVSRPSIKATFT